MSIPPQVIALCASLSYACVLVTSRRGMQYSTPKTVTLVSLIVHTVSLWTAVLLTGGIPRVDAAAVYVFIVAGMLQPIIRLCTYTGVHRVGAARSAPIRSTHPMFGVCVAITVLGETATLVTLAGVVSVVCGIVLITWKRASEVRSFQWWEFLFPLTAALLAGIVHPMRRYALAISHEPLFFAALVGIVSLLCFLAYMPFSREPLVWDRRAMLPFLAAGAAETCGILLGDHRPGHRQRDHGLAAGGHQPALDHVGRGDLSARSGADPAPDHRRRDLRDRGHRGHLPGGVGGSSVVSRKFLQ